MSSATRGTQAARPAVLAEHPGPKTTEFWVTVGTNVVSLGVAVAALLGRTVDPGPLQALVPAVAVLAAALSTAFYAHSRASVKAAGARPVPPPALGATEPVRRSSSTSEATPVAPVATTELDGALR